MPPVGPNPLAGQMVGTGGGTYPPLYLGSFESIMAAVSRGEVSLNMLVANNNQFGGNVAAAQLGNPTLMQAISQGLPQNGTNGLNGVAAGGGTVNSSSASCNNQPGSFDQGSSFGGTQTIDAKLVTNNAGVQVSNPIQYGGN